MSGEQALGTQQFFLDLSMDTIHLVEQFYDSDALFEDPLGQHQGVASIKAYYAHLYRQVKSISFEFEDHFVSADGRSESLIWSMTLVSGLNQGSPQTLLGSSYIKRDEASKKVSFHRDYFDMGDFVYEKLPVLRGVIGFVKKKMSSGH